MTGDSPCIIKGFPEAGTAEARALFEECVKLGGHDWGHMHWGVFHGTRMMWRHQCLRCHHQMTTDAIDPT